MICLGGVDCCLFYGCNAGWWRLGLLRVDFWVVDKLLASLCVGLWFVVGFAVVS